MKQLSYVILTLLGLSIAFSGCVKDIEEGVNPGNIDAEIPYFDEASVQKGRLRIKIKPVLEEKMALSHARSGIVEIGDDRIDQLARELGATRIERTFRHGGKFEPRMREAGLHLWYEVFFDEDKPVTRAVSDFSEISDIQYVEPSFKIVHTGGEIIGERLSSTAMALANAASQRAAMPFNDPRLNEQWHYNNDGSLGSNFTAGSDINLFAAWEIETGRPEVIVSVHDGAVDPDHVDLAANIWVNTAEVTGSTGVDDDNNGYVDDIHGWNFYNNRSTFSPSSHGTHVAGTIAAVNNNGIGVAGVAGGDGSPDSGVRIMICQITSATGYDYASDAEIKNSFIYAANNGAVISQNSWGYDQGGALLQSDKAMIDYFIDNAGKDEYGNQVGPLNGGVVIFATGNDALSSNSFPAAIPRVVAVTAMGTNFIRPSYANYGEYVDVIAPGGNDAGSRGVLSTLPNNSYGFMAGTSMACPHVSGVAALVVSKYGVDTPGLTGDRVREILLQGTNDIYFYNPTYTGKLGTGYIDAHKALTVGEKNSPDAVPYFGVRWGAETAVFHWTVPADRDNGKPERFELFYSTLSLSDADFINPSSYINVVSVDTGNNGVGENMSHTIEGFRTNTTYYAAIVAVNSDGNRSPAVIVSGKTNPVEGFTNMPEMVKLGMYGSAEYRIENKEDYDWELESDGSNEVASVSKDGNFLVLSFDATKGTPGDYTLSFDVIYDGRYNNNYVVRYSISDVNNAPYVVQGAQLPTISLTAQQPTMVVDLSSYFADPDNDPLTYEATLSNEGLATYSFDGSAMTISGRNQGAGTIHIMAVDPGGLKSEALSAEIVSNTKGGVSATLYPNPVRTILNISPSESASTMDVKIYNARGAQVLKTTLSGVSGSSPGTVDVSGLTGGSYTVQLNFNGKETKQNITKL